MKKPIEKIDILFNDEDAWSLVDMLILIKEKQDELIDAVNELGLSKKVNG